MNADQAVSLIRPGDHVFIHSVAAAPALLITAMMRRAPELKDIEIYHIHTEGNAPYATTDYRDIFHTNSMFVGANMRSAIETGQADYIPVFLSEVPALFRKKIIPVDVALIQVSPPDKHGYCSLGVSIDVSRAAVQMARIIIAQINPRMPRSHGDGLIHINRIDAAVESDEPLLEVQPPPLTTVQKEIGKNIASLIDNGATLQMGIGAIPDAVLNSLGDHRDLGIHTEMFSDGLINLIEKGVVNGKLKKKHPEKVVASFVMGTRKLYDFIDDNPIVSMLDAAYVNDTSVIRQNPKVTAINSAVEVDLTGQICADSIGTKQYSGVGGQMDFIRGASLSEDGKPIIALPSVTNKGESRIVPYLKQGAGVVTTRAHVHYVVTEFGVANLYGKNLRQRAKMLIDIAHPDHREELERMAFDRFKVLTD